MSLNGNSFEKKQRPIPPQGPQVAVCYSIIDLGTHLISFQNQQPKETPLVHFSWELPNLPKVVFKEGDAPKPLAIFQEYSVFMADNAKLPKLLMAWRGKPVTNLAVELPIFLGQPCLINVEYKNDKQKPEIIYANVAMNGLGVMRLPQGTPVNPLSNPLMFFNLDDYSHAKFLLLPEWIRKRITQSLEWSGIIAKYGPVPTAEASQGIPANTGFAQQQPAIQTGGYVPQATPAVPQAQGFQTNVTIQPPQQQANFGGQPIVGNPFETEQPPF